MRRLFSLGFSLTLALSWLGAGNVAPVRAASFIVNSAADAVDANPGDGICQTATPGECTLRAAIQTANNAGGNDTITLPAGTFALTIPGAGEDAGATGDLDISSNIVITGASPTTTTINASTLSDRVFQILNGNVTISNLTITGGNPGTGANGGGILLVNGSLTLSNVVINTNTADSGGGLEQDGGAVIVSFSTFRSNASSTATGGGLNIAKGTAVINNSTFDANTAATAGGGVAVSSGAQVRLNSSTLAGNTASGSAVTAGGGGLFAAGSAQLNSVTVAHNTAANAGGGVLQLGGSISLRNTLVADNTNASAPDCSGALTSQGYNLLEDGAGCGGIVNNVNGDIVVSSIAPTVTFTLDSPGDNGGPTRTIALHSGAGNGALAIDAGNPAGCGDGSASFSNDQRGPGFSRYQNGRCDIGAFEYIFIAGTDQPTNLPTNTLTPSVTPIPSLTFTPTQTFTNAPTSTNTPTSTATQLATATATQAPKAPLFTSAPPTVDFGPTQTAQLRVALTGAVLTAAAAVPTSTPNVGLTGTAFAAANASPTLTATASATPTPASTLAMPAEDAVLAVSESAGRAGGQFICGLWMLEAPPGAAPEGSHFQCATVPGDDSTVPSLPSGLRGFWQTTEIKMTGSNGAAISAFTQPLKLCGYYSGAYAAAVGGDAKRFTIYTASAGGEWQALSTEPDGGNQRVCAAVDHFSLFRLAGQPASAASTGGIAGLLSGGVTLYAAIACGLLLLVVFIIVIIAFVRGRKPKEA